ncbi:hypothetical protein CAEBREN_13702 [Caenorhabditis brenneri]|uniref:Uncharacterized protein n=1 Tax=Caenorhabditis brenneri TaxID=135651 RepID=G0PF81_CAEBE|nr:hypothetical protein CAEBREN_13702 [Caenorhabditis brenneri]
MNRSCSRLDVYFVCEQEYVTEIPCEIYCQLARSRASNWKRNSTWEARQNQERYSGRGQSRR